jgi:OOP family OmpA-OmpF porin
LHSKVREGGFQGVNDASVNFAVNYYFNKPIAPVVAEPAPAPQPEPPAPEPEKRTITIRLNVEFEFDKAIVRAIYGDELQAVASAMKVHDDITLELEGHTDSRGPDEYNQTLSEDRAAAVKAKIVEDYGIAANRITTSGYGETRPIADNNTDEGRARNRRVVGEMTYTEVVK